MLLLPHKRSKERTGELELTFCLAQSTTASTLYQGVLLWPGALPGHVGFGVVVAAEKASVGDVGLSFLLWVPSLSNHSNRTRPDFS